MSFDPDAQTKPRVAVAAVIVRSLLWGAVVGAFSGLLIAVVVFGIAIVQVGTSGLGDAMAYIGVGLLVGVGLGALTGLILGPVASGFALVGLALALALSVRARANRIAFAAVAGAVGAAILMVVLLLVSGGAGVLSYVLPPLGAVIGALVSARLIARVGLRSFPY